MNAIGRRIIVTAALLGSLLAAVPATGHARAPRERRFIATVQGSQTSTWFSSRANGTVTCFGTSWTEGDGTQEFKFKSKPTKLLAYESGKSIYFSYNSFNRDNYGSELKVPIELKRSGEYRHGEDAGPCGGGEPTTDTGPYDCGTKTSVFEANLSTNSRSKLELSMNPLIGYPWRNFQDCPLIMPEGVSDPFTTIEQAFSRKKLFSARKGLTIKARASYEKTPEIGSRASATTGVVWTLRLKPVKK